MLGSSAESTEYALRVFAKQENWLLILDNADELASDHSKYFPSGIHGSILMTSRDSGKSGLGTVGSKELTGLDEKECVEVLLKAAKIPRGKWMSYDEAARDIVQLLGSHPLALIQAGPYVAQGRCPLHKYPKALCRQRQRLFR